MDVQIAGQGWFIGRGNLRGERGGKLNHVPLSHSFYHEECTTYKARKGRDLHSYE